MADTLSNKTKSNDFDWPTSDEDHISLEKWVYGDELLGTFAKNQAAWKRYRKDVEEASGNEDAYFNGGVLYVDTFHKDGIGKQLKRLKK